MSLEGTQFRCGGSVEYVNWIEAVLSGEPSSQNRSRAKSWKRDAIEAANLTSGTRMEFRLFDNPEDMELELRKRHAQGSSVRVLSSDSREWKTVEYAKPHSVAPEMMDFHEPFVKNGQRKHWSRIWNHIPKKTDYTWFVMGHPKGLVATDPLCEVGCPYAVRGFDYDYVGILWLNDLVWSGDRWSVNPKAVADSGLSTVASAAADELTDDTIGPATTELLERVRQAYRILFTRALKGVYVWIPDRSTHDHVAESL